MKIIAHLRDTRVPVIVVTAAWRIRECVECMQEGAWDFILKSHLPETLVDLVVASIERAKKRESAHVDHDAQWVHDNLDELCSRHAGLWIAVEGGRVWAVEDTYDDLRKSVK